jgi:hypothetical protein
MPPEPAPLRFVARTLETLHQSVALPLRNPLVHANYADGEDLAWRRWLLSLNAARTTTLRAVTLVRHAPGCLVDTDRHYLTLAGDRLVAEQTAPWLGDPGAAGARLAARAAEAIDIDAPCLLLARYGETTWGHWIGDMLIKAALAERHFPGRFAYAVPAPIVTGGSRYATRVLESLAAYAIAPARLIPLESPRPYRFAALHDIADARTDAIHPEALAALRALPARRAATPPRLAALRAPARKRGIHGIEALDPVLARHGIAPLDPAALPFQDQVAAFRHADLVVASLGSECTAALWAPEGARIVTVAPLGWRDDYFAAIFQQLGLRHADLRGASTRIGSLDPGLAPHAIDPARLDQGIQAALAAPEAAPGLARAIDGEAMPASLGAPLLDLGFGQAGNARRFCREGWSDPELGHTWSLGKRATLVLQAAALPRQDLWLYLDGHGHVLPPILPFRPMRVLANGHPIGFTEAIRRTRAYLFLPRSVLAQAPELRLEFEHPVCAPPSTLGPSPDTRELGFGFARLALFAAG